MAELERKCLHHISKHFIEIYKTDDWLNSSLECIIKILSEDNLEGEELEIFKAGMLYIKYQTDGINNKKLVNSIIKCIRFDQMNTNSLIEISCDPTALLCEKFESMILDALRKVHFKAPLTSTPRGKIRHIQRYTKIGPSWGYNSLNPDRLGVIVDRTVRLLGWTLFCAPESEYKIVIDVLRKQSTAQNQNQNREAREDIDSDINNTTTTTTTTPTTTTINDNTNTNTATTTTNINNDDISHYCSLLCHPESYTIVTSKIKFVDILLSQPVILDAHVHYIISSKINGPFSPAGEQCEPVLQFDNVTFTFSSVARYRSNGTGKTTGQFAGLIVRY